jgi:DNA-3-methyladenine glycosylase
VRLAPGERLSKAFYDRPVVDVARDLIGCTLLHGGVGGRIVETEAYHPTEPASHGFVGKTARNEVLFGGPGFAYVYFSYGVHSLFNAVCESEGVGAGVLIRALQPTHGIEEMRARRGVERDRDLCSGPGKLAQALDIQLGDNGSSLVDGSIGIAAPTATDAPYEIVASSRIGITKAVELDWRFYAAGVEHVSGKKLKAT